MTFDLKTARINSGKSIRGLSVEIDVPEQTLRALESGRGAHPSNALKVAEYFGVTVIDLPYFAARAKARATDKKAPAPLRTAGGVTHTPLEGADASER